MAITYHAGRRIQGTSDAVSNWTDANGTNGTGAGQYDSSNTSGDNSFNYDTVNDRVDFSVVRTSNTPNCMMKDLTSSTNGIGTALSTTDFRIRFKIHWTNWDDKGDVAFFMGLSSFSRSEAINGSNSNDIRKPSGGDSIQIVFDNARLGGAANCWNWMTFGYAENTSTTTNFGGDSTHHAVDLEVANTILSSGNYNCGIPANASTYFCEIIRSGGTTLTLNISKTAYGLSDVSGASNSALGKTTSGTCTSSFGTTRPLKYLFLAKTGGVSSYNNKIEGYMSDIQVQSTGSSSIDRGQLTDVQLGSRFEETDTRKMYHYEVATPTKDYDMTTDPRTNTFDTSGVTTITHANSTLQLNQLNASGQMGSATYIDLGSALSTKWVMRFRTKQSAYTSYMCNSQFQVGMSSVAPTSTAYNISSSLNWIGFRWYFGTQFSAPYVGIEPRIQQNASDNTHSNTNARLYGKPNETTDTTTSYYHEFIWNVDTFTYNLYDNANYTGTKLATATMSSSSNTHWVTGTPSSISGLQYLVFKEGSDSQGGVWVNQLDDVQIWDGVIVPATGNAWTEEGT